MMFLGCTGMLTCLHITVAPTPVKCCHVSAKGGMLVEGQELGGGITCKVAT